MRPFCPLCLRVILFVIMGFRVFELFFFVCVQNFFCDNCPGSLRDDLWKKMKERKINTIQRAI